MMNIGKEFEKRQPILFERFKQILEHRRLSHAYLFSGDFFTYEAAIWLAQSQFCQDLQNGLPCQACNSCKRVVSGDFPDVKVIQPTNQVIKTETIRQMIREFYQSSYEGSLQFFIIKDADKMHVNAANALLKVIEEPQGQVCIIFITSDSDKMLATIRSRCQLFQFPSNLAYFEAILQEEGLLMSQARLLASLVKDEEEARSIAHQSKWLELLQITEQFMSLWKTDINSAFLELNKLVVLCSDKQEQERSFDILTAMAGKDKSLHQVRYLNKISQAQVMWQANVSYQNALEYMILSH